MYTQLFEQVLEAVHEIQSTPTSHTEAVLASEIQVLVDELLEYYIQEERE
jgi:hypothetical protein